MNDTDFKKKLSAYVDEINSELLRAVREIAPRDVIVSEAMEYSLMAGGKRVRPVIAMGVCEALGGDMEKAKVFGCAIEMTHTYSLIHDDLPCMDNDNLRRGKPTCHVRYGEANALLAGDALLTMAFEYITKNTADCEKAFRFIRCLSECAGISGMVGGQADDIKAETERADMEKLISIHERKTGALINAAGAAGAIAAGKEDDEVRKYTSHLGIAFQIKDDILDVEGDEAKMGKTLMKDIYSDKSTYVTLLGMDAAKAELLKESRLAEEALEPFGEKGEFLLKLTEALLKRDE